MLLVSSAVACDGRTRDDEPNTLASACRALVDAWAAKAPRCGLPVEPREVEPRVRFCIAMTGAPGSGVSVADLNSCTRTFKGPTCDRVIYGSWCENFGDRPAADAPRGKLGAGAPCISLLQCESGQCSGRYGACGVCQEVVKTVGGACDDIHACGERLECVSGACARVGVADGRPCSGKGDDCNDASFCDRSSTEPVCAPRIGLGGSCASRPCEKELVCHDQVCKAPPVEGAACLGAVCGPGLYCALGVCTTPLPLGAACDGSEPCVSGAACMDGTCTTPRLDRPEGALCNWDRCAVGLICTVASDGFRCAVGPRAGEPCTADNRCATGLRCEYWPEETRICVPVPRVGEPCTFDTQCESGATCLGAKVDPYERGKCVAYPREGESCGSDLSCAQFLSCNQGRCASPDLAACAR